MDLFRWVLLILILSLLTLLVGFPLAHAGAPRSEAEYGQELLRVLEETKSVETFLLTLSLLEDTAIDPCTAVPVILRNAERLEILKDHRETDEEVACRVWDVVTRLHGKRHEQTKAARGSEETASTPQSKAPDWATERMKEKECWKNDLRTPILPPIRDGEQQPACTKPPSERQILRALPALQQKSGVKTYRDNVEVVVELVVDKLDAPRFFPLVGPARLHHCHWKCTVYCNEKVEIASPFWVCFSRLRTDVVYIDRDHLHLCPPEEESEVAPTYSEDGEDR
jgi:hypothetical protein